MGRKYAVKQSCVNPARKWMDGNRYNSGQGVAPLPEINLNFRIPETERQHKKRHGEG